MNASTPDATATLAQLRKAIDALDDELAALLARRFELTGAVGVQKALLGETAINPARQAAQRALVASLAERHGLPAGMMADVYGVITQEIVKRHLAAGARPNSQGL